MDSEKRFGVFESATTKVAFKTDAFGEFGKAGFQDLAEMKKPLPDFTKIFIQTSSAPLDFNVRPRGNFSHDIIYLSSYLHDATFKLSDLKIQDDVLTINLERDRCSSKNPNMPAINCKLTISPILKCKLTIDIDGREAGKISQHCFEIRRVQEKSCDTDEGESFVRLSIEGSTTCHCKLVVDINEPPQISLKDATKKQKSKISATP